MNRNEMNPSQEVIFQGLIKNAFDFLFSSISEQSIEKTPQYSLINFCTALELFLKARLLREHWVLIYENPTSADRTEFEQGDFNSVSIKSAIDRLRKVCRRPISKQAEEAFDAIRRHRNRLVHFYHPAFSEGPRDPAIQEVMVEQFRAWFYLYPLLAKDWREVFEPYFQLIKVVEAQMRKRKEYLGVIFERRQEGIRSGKESGAVFSVCEACQYLAARCKDRLVGPLFSVKCVVCEIEGRAFEIECLDCKRKTAVGRLFPEKPDADGVWRNHIEVQCEQCRAIIRLSDIGQALVSSADGSSPTVAFCGCACLDSSAPESSTLIEDKWVCLNCKDLFDDVYGCEGCGRTVTGSDGEFTCVVCLEDECAGIQPESGEIM